MITTFPSFESSKLLVHIAFHFVKDRIKYIEKVVDNFHSFEFSQIDIVINTNSEEAQESLSFKHCSSQVTIKFVVHRNLHHPYLLTWQHRNNMYASLNNYDYFMYLEDDIYVPYQTLLRWRKDSELLYPKGYLRGFLRVEKNKQGALVCVDQYKRAKIKNLVRIESQLFYFPHVPYQAFWICDQHQMKHFVASPAWDNNKTDWCIRERAAAGMTLLLRKNHKNQKHNLLIPLDEKDRILKDAMVYHLPNNYADNPKVFASKLTVDQLMNLGFWAQIYKNSLKRAIEALERSI